MHHSNARFCRRALIALVSMVLVSCSDQPTAPAPAPSRAIVDAFHGGQRGFYFMPPLVPLRNARPKFGVPFDPNANPTVIVCQVFGVNCVKEIAVFRGGQVKVHPNRGVYEVLWLPPIDALSRFQIYRIEVWAGHRLGYADVLLSGIFNPLNPITRDHQYVVISSIARWQITFRIDQGVVAP